MQGGEQEKVRTKLNSIRKWSPININWKDFYLLIFRIKWGSTCSWLGKWKQTCANQKERCFVTSHFTLILSGEDVVACSVQTKKKNKQMGPLLLREMCAGQNMNLRPLLVVPTTWCLCWRVLNTHLSAPKNPKCTPRSTERVRALHALATQSATAATTASRPAVGSRLFIPRTWNLASYSLPNSTIRRHVDQAPPGPGKGSIPGRQGSASVTGVRISTTPTNPYRVSSWPATFPRIQATIWECTPSQQLHSHWVTSTTCANRRPLYICETHLKTQQGPDLTIQNLPKWAFVQILIVIPDTVPAASFHF